MSGMSVNSSGTMAYTPKVNLASNNDNVINSTGPITKQDVQGAINSKSDNIFIAVKDAQSNSVVMHKVDLKANPDILNQLMNEIDKNPNFKLSGNVNFTASESSSTDAKVTNINNPVQMKTIIDDPNNAGKITFNSPTISITTDKPQTKSFNDANDNTLVVLKSYGMVNATADEVKDGLKEKKAGLNESKEPLENKQKGLEKEQKSIEKQISKLQDSFYSNKRLETPDEKKEMADLKAKLKDIKADIKEVKTEIKTIDAQIGKIESQLDTFKEKGRIKMGDALPPDFLLKARDDMFKDLKIPENPDMEVRLKALKTKLMDKDTFKNGGDPIPANHAENIIDMFRDAAPHGGTPTPVSMEKTVTSSTGNIIEVVPKKPSSADIKAAVENYDKTEIPRLKKEIDELKSNPNTPPGVIKEKEDAMGKIENRFNHLQNVNKLAYIAPNPNPDAGDKSAINNINGTNYTLQDVVKADLKDIVDKFKGNPDGLYEAIKKTFGDEKGFTLTKEDAGKILKAGTDGVSTKKEVGELQDTLAKIGGGFKDLLSENGINQGHDGKYGFATTKEVRFLSYALTNQDYGKQENIVPVTTENTTYSVNQTQTKSQTPAQIVFDTQTTGEKIDKLWDKIKIDMSGGGGNGLHGSKKDWGSTKCPVF